MNKKNQDKIFDEVFEEIENMSQEDVDRMNQNIDNEIKRDQIKNFGVEYDHLSIFYNEFNLFCDAINQIIQENDKLILKDFTIHKIKLNEGLFENESIELLFTHNNKPNEFKHIKMNDQIFDYFFDNDNDNDNDDDNDDDDETSKKYYNILNYILNESYNLKHKKDKHFKYITNQLLKGGN